MKSDGVRKRARPDVGPRLSAGRPRKRRSPSPTGTHIDRTYERTFDKPGSSSYGHTGRSASADARKYSASSERSGAERGYASAADQTDEYDAEYDDEYALYDASFEGVGTGTSGPIPVNGPETTLSQLAQQQGGQPALSQGANGSMSPSPPPPAAQDHAETYGGMFDSDGHLSLDFSGMGLEAGFTRMSVGNGGAYGGGGNSYGGTSPSHNYVYSGQTYGAGVEYSSLAVAAEGIFYGPHLPEPLVPPQSQQQQR